MESCKYFKDQLQRKVVLPIWPPQRIISLVPSQTAFLAELGLAEEVVGITKFCIHPTHWFQKKCRVGGTKTLHIPRIISLKPDLIIGNKEENVAEQIDMLAARFPVWISDVNSLPDALDMMRNIGVLTDRLTKAEEIVQSVRAGFAPLGLESVGERAAYLIWRKPYMAAGGQTFIDDMMRYAGLENVFHQMSRYPEISEEALKEADPAVILLSSEPYPFQEKHMLSVQRVCPNATVLLVDGEMFSWYGSHLLKAPEYFQRLREQWRGR